MCVKTRTLLLMRSHPTHGMLLRGVHSLWHWMGRAVYVSTHALLCLTTFPARCLLLTCREEIWQVGVGMPRLLELAGLHGSVGSHRIGCRRQPCIQARRTRR